jgi:hypothetical protein
MYVAYITIHLHTNAPCRCILYYLLVNAIHAGQSRGGAKVACGILGSPSAHNVRPYTTRATLFDLEVGYIEVRKRVPEAFLCSHHRAFYKDPRHVYHLSSSSQTPLTALPASG